MFIFGKGKKEVPEEVSAEEIQTHNEPIEADEASKQKQSFFSKLKSGLGKTRDALNEKVDSVLKVFKKIDEELYEELEEALIMADVGVETSMYIIEKLRGKVKEKHLTESSEVKVEIAEIISEILSDNDNSSNM